MSESRIQPHPLSVRHIGAVNWIGFWTLYSKEVRRFLKVWGQTVFAPMVTMLLFLAIFTLALGGAVRTVGDIPFVQFLAPGLIMMAIVQNSFANTSSTIMVAKIQAVIVDVLMPPLTSLELVTAFALGGMTRGLVVGISVTLAMSFFVPLEIVHFWAVLFFAVSGSLMLSLMGLIAGVWADKFDHMAVITNFVITPLAFLSGTFYSVEKLPGIWRTISSFDPFFYMIDGFRYGFIGAADDSPVLGVVVMLGMNAALGWIAFELFRRGYKIKA
ncbi:MAG: ABC transporter permease [Alphaproteobacteria bacterium]|jgi:ABC-2 type transport system permease protein|nr:ABC transporter permease [Alphaproteobacteria bacterium]MBT4082367.1 ABC transporter permease [Alphaproteobacteria bacterium]MBT4545469.1 ABC transporter permease [Alphaproteobacteria bacterium]MBT7746469.1 ABC transporter permease [Alphaproteobacteria bacterium]